MKDLKLAGFFDGLANADWTEFCGEQIDAQDVRVLQSLHDARVVSMDRRLENLMLEYANTIRDQVRNKSLDAYRQWNSHAIPLREQAIQLIDRKLSPDALGKPIPKPILDSVGWIIVHAGIEIVYSDLVTMTMYTSMANWLLRGHLPISWDGGMYPVGKAIIY